MNQSQPQYLLDAPIEKTIVKTFTKFAIRDMFVNLNQSAYMTVNVYQGDNVYDFECIRIDIPSNIYAEWGADDTYIINYIKQYLTTYYQS
jgi:hypothetical protein